MRTFELHRDIDETGISGVGIIAQGVKFDRGKCVLCWLTNAPSITVFDDEAQMLAVHGHAGKTRIVYTGNAYLRGKMDAAQDSCENCPFASVGGLEARSNLIAPKYVTPTEHDEYLTGYRDQCRSMFGDDWQTCSFGWGKAITVGDR